MKSSVWRVSADVTAFVRSGLLARHPPRLQRIYLQSITWAYGVADDFPFDPAMTDCVLYGIHRCDRHEAFLVSLGGKSYRPDGSLLHLTLSTASGVRPAEAGQIDPGAVERISPELFGTQLKLQPIFVQGYEINHAA